MSRMKFLWEVPDRENKSISKSNLLDFFFKITRIVDIRQLGKGGGFKDRAHSP